MPFPLIRPLRLATSSLLLLLLCALAHAQNAPSPASAANTPAVRPAGSEPVDGTAQPPAAAAAVAAPAASADPTLLSRDARRIYELSRDKLVQIRTLLRNANTQASIGSGFFVSADGLIVTNFHVASQLALEPERYRGVYVTMEGQEGEVELLAFDVQRDLAVLRAKGRRAAAPVLGFRPTTDPLAQGAPPGRVAGLVLWEALWLAATASVLGLLLGHTLAHGLGWALQAQGLLPVTGFIWLPAEVGVPLLAAGVAALAALLPAVQAYRTDVADLLSQP